MDIIEEKNEVACCRVCHGESEPDNQLFFPCKCDGSIKYVHQECLIQWLKVSKKKKCELCGEEFHFQKVYKSDAPYHISLIDIVVELLPKILGMIQYSFFVALAMIMWGLFLPLFTNWWLKFCWCVIVGTEENCFMNIPTFIKERSLEGGLNYWYFGLVDVCIIVAASIIAFEILDTLRREYRIANNNYQIRQLERRLAENRTALRNYELEDQQREQAMFAVADFESMKVEWDVSKKQYTDTIVRTKSYMDSKQEEGSHNNSSSSSSSSSNDNSSSHKNGSNDSNNTSNNNISNNNNSNNSNDLLYEENQEIMKNSSQLPINTNEPLATTRSALPLEPSLEDRFLMVQSLVNDYEYCGKIVLRLHVICNCTTSPATTAAIASFKPILDSYTKLHDELEKTTKQCLELIRLLPSSLVPMKTDIGSKHTYPTEFQDSPRSRDFSRPGVSSSYQEYWREMHESAEDSESVDLVEKAEEDLHSSKIGAWREGDLLEGEDNEEDQQLLGTSIDKVSHPSRTATAAEWYEQEEGVEVDSIAPSVDNLELRANLILRRRLREAAAVARMAATASTHQQQTGEDNSTRAVDNIEQLSGIYRETTTAARGDIYTADADNRDTVHSAQMEEESSELSSELLRGHRPTDAPHGEVSVHSIDDYPTAQSGWEELEQLQCDAAFYCDDEQELDSTSSSSNDHSAASHANTSLTLSQDLNTGINSRIDVVSGGYDDQDYAVAQSMLEEDNTELAAADAVPLDEIRPTTENTDVGLDGRDNSEMSIATGNNDGNVLESSVQHGIEQTGDRPVQPAPVQDIADMAPAAAAVGEEEAILMNPIHADEGDVAEEGPVDPAIAPAAGGEAPLVVPGPVVLAGGAAGNNQFISLENVAIAYGYVTVFVIATVLIPATVGNLILLLNGIGATLAGSLRTTAFEVVGHEDSYLHMLKLFDSFEDSRDLLTTSGTEGDVAARLHAAELISAHLLAFAKLAIGYVLIIFAAGVTFIGYYAHFMGTFEPFHFNVNAGNNIFTVLQRNSQVIREIATTAVKIALIVSVFAGLYPTILTILTAKFVNKSLPTYLRSNDNTSLPILLICGLFVFSSLISAHIWYITLEIRRNIYRKYLIGILPSAEHLEANNNNNHTFLEMHEKLKSRSFPSIFKSFLIRISILLPAYLFCVVVPLRWGHLFCPFEGPLLFRLKQGAGELQIPVEMMLSHIFIPLIIEKMRYRAVVKSVTGAFFTWTAPLLGLEWILDVDPTAPAVEANVGEVPVGPLPEVPPVLGPDAINPEHEQLVEPIPEEAVNALNWERNENTDEVRIDNSTEAAGNVPPGNDAEDSQPAPIDPIQPADPATATTPQHPSSAVVWLRLCLLCALGLFTLAVLSSWALHAPLAAGRCALHLLRMPTHNDLFNYPVGLLICWALCFVGHYIVQDVTRHAGVRSAFTATIKWVALAGKVLGVGILWLGLPPMLIGVLLETLIIDPLRLPVTETPLIPFMQNWALGLIILKAFSKCVLTGMFGENDLRTQMEMTLIRGFAQFDATLCLRHIVWPVTLQLLDLLLIPFFIARIACVLTSSYLLRTIMMRYCYHVYILTILVGYGLRHSVYALIRLHNEVRDSKYLIGTRLTNRA